MVREKWVEVPVEVLRYKEVPVEVEKIVEVEVDDVVYEEVQVEGAVWNGSLDQWADKAYQAKGRVITVGEVRSTCILILLFFRAIVECQLCSLCFTAWMHGTYLNL